MPRTIYGEPLSGDAFTDRRRSGIGGSDAGAILGVSPWASALSVWEQKRGLVTDEFRATERMIWGTRLEGAIIAGYEEDTGRKVRRGGRAFLRHPELQWVVGHPDGLAEDRLVEVKTTAYLDSQWGEPGSADIPAPYFAQVQHYMVLTGKPLTDVPVLVGGRELHLFTVPADRSFQDALMGAEAAFWELVASGEPPAPDGSESAGAVIRRMFPRSVPDSIVATPEVQQMAAAFIAARAGREQLAKEADRMAQLMQTFMGARQRMVGPGFNVSWGDRKGSVSWKGYAEAVEGSLVRFMRETHPERLPELMEALELMRAGATGPTTRGAFLLTETGGEDR